MKWNWMQTVFALALAVCALDVAHARLSAKDDDLRNRILSSAAEVGIETSTIWLRVDSSRKLVQLGGTVRTTNNIFTLFSIIASAGSAGDTISNVSQSITSPQGPNPFPREFLAGYQPSSKAALKKLRENVDEQADAALYVELSRSLGEQLVVRATNAPREFLPGQLVVEGKEEDVGVSTCAPLPSMAPPPPE